MRRCEICGTTETEAIASEHDWDDEFTIDVEPTCTTDGSKSKHCKRCGVIGETSVTIPKTGHTEEVDPAVEPTCTETGLTAGSHCSVCNAVLVEPEEVPALGHKYDDGVVTQAPTTEKDGVITYTCSVCEASYEVIIPKLENEQADANEAVETAGSAAAAAEQAAEAITESSSNDTIADADQLATDAVSDAEAAVTKAEEAYQEALEEYGEDSGATIYAQTMVDEAKKLRAEALVVSATVKTVSAKASGSQAAQARSAATAAAATPGDAAVAAAQKAETLAKETAEKAGAAAKVAEEAFEAVKDAGYEIDSEMYIAAEKAANEAAAYKINAETAAAEASKAVDKAKKAKEEAKKPVERKAADGTSVGEGASYTVAEKAILNATTDEGPAGTTYSKLRLRSPKQTQSSVTIKWNSPKGATKYVIYGNVCGNTNKMKKLATVTGNSKVFSTIDKSSVRKGTYYKFIVVALDKNDTVVSTSKVIHVATKGGKVGNHKSVSVKKKVSTKAKKLKVGKSLKVNAKALQQSKSRKVEMHRKVRYESSNAAIATVTKAGTIKAKKKGTCYVYAYAQNGVYKRIKVVVK